MSLLSNKFQFWITNVSDRNVCLSDLALTVKARTSYNLLDEKHFSYTPEQLETSAASGSLFVKKDKIKIRKVQPTIPIQPGIYIANERTGKKRSLVEIKQKQYEELNVSDEKFAEESVSDIE